MYGNLIVVVIGRYKYNMCNNYKTQNEQKLGCFTKPVLL